MHICIYMHLCIRMWRLCMYMDRYFISKLCIRVNKKEIVNFKKGIGIEKYTQFTTVTLIYEKST